MNPAPELTPRQARIVLAMAESDMRYSKAAVILHFHKNTIDYHITKIRENTGLDPKCFYDLCKLVEMAKTTKGM
jgi:sugar diacid utilization regulator